MKDLQGFGNLAGQLDFLQGFFQSCRYNKTTGLWLIYTIH